MTKPSVQIFLSTYNGEKYLSEQINSLLNQNDVSIHILARDDHSTDETVSILEKYKRQGALDFYCGKNIGYAKSFLHLLTNKVHADYYAFCDQDDVWLPDKLISGIKMLTCYTNQCIPLLYASSLTRVDEKLNFISTQEFKNLKLTLGAEFTRHRLAGCTFIFNNFLFSLLNNAYYMDQLQCSHDKLATIVCLACGGHVVFDKNAHILFRRHGVNTSRDSMPVLSKATAEFSHFLSDNYKAHCLAASILTNFRPVLSPIDDKLLHNIQNYRKSLFGTLALVFSPDIDCGFWFFNLFIRMMILIHHF